MMPPLAGSIFSDPNNQDLIYVAIGLAVFVGFLIGSRLLARAITAQLHQRHLPIGMVVVPALSDVGVTMDDITMCFAPVVTDPAFVSTIVEKP